MKVLLVTGIFPPAIGGPATHAEDVARELRRRGHEVRILTLADGAEFASERGVTAVPRRWPWFVRSLWMVMWMAIRARGVDVVYATGLGPIAVAGARLANRPVVLKFVADPAWERAERQHLTSATFAAFQQVGPSSLRVRAMQAVRDWSARAATVVVTPSAQLSDAAARWRGRRDVVTIPNGASTAADGENATSRLDETPSDGTLRLVFVGRLVAVKRVDHLIRATAAIDAARLEVVGDGPEFDQLIEVARRLAVDDRVIFSGRLDHEETRRRIAAADALVLSSAHEGLPHVVLEALTSGTPVVATRNPGVVGVVEDGQNGLLVDDDGLEPAIRRLADDRALLAALASGARQSGARWGIDACVDRLEALMRSVSGRRPRAVFVGKSRASVPPTPADERKYAINEAYIETVVICPASQPGVSRPAGARIVGLPDIRTPVVGSALFYVCAPALAVAVAAARAGSVVVCQSPFEGTGVLAFTRLLPRSRRPRVQIELHGDWRTATRLYGSRTRRVWSRWADRVAEHAVRRADRIRPVSRVLEHQARDAGYEGPIDRFVAYSDYGPFLEAPPLAIPDDPCVLFAGVMERYKGIDVLLAAWPLVLERVPAARLVMVGAGSLDDFVRDQIRRGGLEREITVRGAVAKSEIPTLLDAATCLVLPSRSEGLPRIALEAMARGRAVVATRVGGLAELVDPGVSGWLVEPESADTLADALVVLLESRDLAAKMGDAARASAEVRDPATEYELGIERLARWIEAR